MTKHVYLLLILSVLVVSCKNEEENAVLGTWRLEEELIDPGDGSGQFQPVDSDKTITFLKKGELESNGSLCAMSSESGSPTTGEYNTKNKSISPDDCYINFNEPFVYYYYLEDSKLILSFPCFEGCRQKYRKVE